MHDPFRQVKHTHQESFLHFSHWTQTHQSQHRWKTHLSDEQLPANIAATWCSNKYSIYGGVWVEKERKSHFLMSFQVQVTNQRDWHSQVEGFNSTGRAAFKALFLSWQSQVSASNQCHIIFYLNSPDLHKLFCFFCLPPCLLKGTVAQEETTWRASGRFFFVFLSAPWGKLHLIQMLNESFKSC